MSEHQRGWWNMYCFNALSLEQQRHLIQHGNLEIGYKPEGTCTRPAEVEITTMWDDFPGPRFYCCECGAEYLRLLTPERLKPAPPEKPPCEGFGWVGQDMAHCEDCGRDISEHKGLSWNKPGQGPFTGKRGERPEKIIIPFDEARKRIPLFALYVTPIGVPEDYAGPYRYDKADGWTTE